MSFGCFLKHSFAVVLGCVSIATFSKDLILVQAHRGASAVKTENTLPAFREALQVGADSIELDVHLTKDGHWIIYHDFVLEPGCCHLADGTPLKDPWVIQEKTLKELQSLWILSSSTQRTVDPAIDNLAQDKLPTLIEVVEDLDKRSRLTGKTIEIDIEVKSDEEPSKHSPAPEVLAKKAVQFLKLYGTKSANPLTVRSFDPRVLEIIRMQMPHQKIAFLTEVGISDFVERAQKIKPQIFAPHFEQITKENVQLAHSLGAQVIPWTVNSPEDWQRVIDLGGDGVTTDHPGNFKKFLETTQQRVRKIKAIGPCDGTFGEKI